MRVLLITPPMLQVNAPYPATPFLTGYLRSLGHDVRQEDLSIALAGRLFSSAGLSEVRRELESTAPRTVLCAPGDSVRGQEGPWPSHSTAHIPVRVPEPRHAGRKARGTPAVRHFLSHSQRIIEVVDSVVRFLQGRDPTLALRIAARRWLPEGPRFEPVLEGDDEGDADVLLREAFGFLGLQDGARYLATLFLEDIADAVRDGLDARFEISRYGEQLAASAPSFDPLAAALAAPPTLLDRWLEALTDEACAQHAPDLVGLTVPFPGNVYGAFRIAQRIRHTRPPARIALGGGYPNTELRELADPRVFDFVDFVLLDAGEASLPALIAHLEGRAPAERLVKTFRREDGRVAFRHDPAAAPPPADPGAPTCDGLPLDRYLSVFDTLNPMHRLWSDGRWNKLLLAHGCYWAKCAFCDVTLDYIERYRPAAADALVDRMAALIRETGQTGFHFVDEAAPPALLRALAQRLIARGVTCTWWGNIRFEKTFTPDLCRLLAESGCIAVSGGLETADDRLLALMEKGVTREQAARVTRAFSDAGIMVHAYLMYGFPSQTARETVDALDYVRQLFAEGCIHSGFWHRFALTVHSPIFRDPARFGITIPPPLPATFARNETPFADPAGTNHDRLGVGLRLALQNYMTGAGLDLDVRTWFPVRVPAPKISPDFVASALHVPRPRRRKRRPSAKKKRTTDEPGAAQPQPKANP